MSFFAKSTCKILHFILLKRIMKNTKYFLRLGNACFWPDILHWTCLQDKALWYSEMQLIIQFGLAKGNNHYPRFFRIRWRTIGFKKLNLAIRYHILSTQDICIHILFVPQQMINSAFESKILLSFFQDEIYKIEFAILHSFMLQILMVYLNHAWLIFLANYIGPRTNLYFKR